MERLISMVMASGSFKGYRVSVSYISYGDHLIYGKLYVEKWTKLEQYKLN